LVTNIDALRDAVRRVRARAPFHIDAWVVLPDHMDVAVCRFSGSVASDQDRVRDIASDRRAAIMTSRGERGIWQRRYWGHTIRDDRDFAAHMDYTHFNLVKHGLVAHPRTGRIVISPVRRQRNVSRRLEGRQR
jgi:putative transposase